MMKIEHLFLDVDDPKLVLQAINETRIKWDTGIERFDELKEYTSENTSVHRLLMNSILNLSQREFIDKKFFFTRK